VQKVDVGDQNTRHGSGGARRKLWTAIVDSGVDNCGFVEESSDAIVTS
jgi:hypothetical protein